MGKRFRKITAELWVEAARHALVEGGIEAVKVDRLASRLGVTRGGFFHYFKDRQELLATLLRHWEGSCQLHLEEKVDARTKWSARCFERAFDRLLGPDDFDFQFDLAVREWARVDRQAAGAVRRADRRRLLTVQSLFQGFGYDPAEARIRSRIFYSLQIGCCAVDGRAQQPRRRDIFTYLEMLCDPGLFGPVAESSCPGKRPGTIKVAARAIPKVQFDWRETE